MTKLSVPLYLLKLPLCPNGVIDAIPNEWRSIIKRNPYCAPSPLDQTCFVLKIAGKTIDLANITSKLVYREFCSFKQTSATAKAKILSKYPDLSIDWKRLYSLAFETTLDTKLREFQYKLFNLIVFTNKNFTSSKWWNPPYVFSVMKKRNPWSIYCIFVSHQHSFGKNSYLGSQMKPIFCLMSLIWTFFLENLTLRKVFS